MTMSAMILRKITVHMITQDLTLVRNTIKELEFVKETKSRCRRQQESMSSYDQMILELYSGSGVGWALIVSV